MSDEFKRRADDHDPDKTDEEILKLIRDAKSDSEKAHLIVLYQINRNVGRQVNVLDQVVARLQVQEDRMETHRILVAKGSGAWRAAALTLGAVGVMGSVILIGYFNDLKEVIKGQAEQDMKIIRLETNAPISREADARLKVLESHLVQNTGTLIDLTHRMDDHERSDSQRFGTIPRRK